MDYFYGQLVQLVMIPIVAVQVSIKQEWESYWNKLYNIALFSCDNLILYIEFLLQLLNGNYVLLVNR